MVEKGSGAAVIPLQWPQPTTALVQEGKNGWRCRQGMWRLIFFLSCLTPFFTKVLLGWGQGLGGRVLVGSPPSPTPAPPHPLQNNPVVMSCHQMCVLSWEWGWAIPPKL